MRAMTDIVIAIFWFLIHSFTAFLFWIFYYYLSFIADAPRHQRRCVRFKPLRVALVIAAYNEEDVIKEK